MTFHPEWWDAEYCEMLSEYCEMYLLDCERDTCVLFLLTLLSLSLLEH